MKYQDASSVEYLEQLQKARDEIFKKDAFYNESSRRYAYLKPYEFNIVTGHTMDEFFFKHVKNLRNGIAAAYKKNELWLMNPKAVYWEIPNNTDLLYFEVPGYVPNDVPKSTAIIAYILLSSSIIGAICGFALHKYAVPLDPGGGGGGGGGGETYTGFNLYCVSSWCSGLAILDMNPTNDQDSYDYKNPGVFPASSYDYYVKIEEGQTTFTVDLYYHIYNCTDYNMSVNYFFNGGDYGCSLVKVNMAGTSYSISPAIYFDENFDLEALPGKSLDSQENFVKGVKYCIKISQVVIDLSAITNFPSVITDDVFFSLY